MDNTTRVFFIVDVAHTEVNREIFHTLELAEEWAQEVRKQYPKGTTNESDDEVDIDIRIGMVRHAYREPELMKTKRQGWNYEDHSDTFQEDKELVISRY